MLVHRNGGHYMGQRASGYHVTFAWRDNVITKNTYVRDVKWTTTAAFFKMNTEPSVVQGKYTLKLDSRGKKKSLKARGRHVSYVTDHFHCHAINKKINRKPYSGKS